MVGRSGSTGLRLAPPVASARSLPERMKGVVCTSDENITLVWPPTTSIMAGPAPRDGTSRRATLAGGLENSPPRRLERPGAPAGNYQAPRRAAGGTARF